MTRRNVAQALEITPRQADVVRTALRFIEREGYTPTANDISIEMRLIQTSVYNHLNELVRKGFVKKTESGRLIFLKTTKGVPIRLKVQRVAA